MGDRRSACLQVKTTASCPLDGEIAGCCTAPIALQKSVFLVVHEGRYCRPSCAFIRLRYWHANPRSLVEVFEVDGFDRKVGGATGQAGIGIFERNLAPGSALHWMLKVRYLPGNTDFLIATTTGVPRGR